MSGEKKTTKPSPAMLDGGDDVTQKPRIPRKERREWELATLAHRVKYLKPQRRRTTQYNTIQRTARADGNDGSLTKCSN